MPYVQNLIQKNKNNAFSHWQAAALSEDGSGETAAGEGMDGGGLPPPRAGDPTMWVAQGGEEAVPLGPTGSRMARSLREALQVGKKNQTKT